MSDVVRKVTVEGEVNVLLRILEAVPRIVDAMAERVRISTQKFVQSTFGRCFLGLTLIGPLTFIPTVWEVWTAPNIDVFRTSTWPLLMLVNVSVFVAVCHHGEWRTRLSMMVWVVLMALMSVAVWVR